MHDRPHPCETNVCEAVAATTLCHCRCHVVVVVAGLRAKRPPEVVTELATLVFTGSEANHCNLHHVTSLGSPAPGA